MSQLTTTNPEHLLYTDDDLQIEVLGGIRIDRLDSLRVTLKMGYEDEQYRHSLDLYNDIQVSKLIRRAAGKLQLGMGNVMDGIEDLTNSLESYRLAERSESEADKHKKVELNKTEAKAATALLESKNLLSVINDYIGSSGVIGETDNRLLMYVIFTSRLMRNPLHLVCMGASGTGKSHLQESVAALFPEEAQLSITDLSESSFYYFEPHELSHKLILIEDLDGAESALYPLRELQSKKVITKTRVQKTAKGQKTVHKTVYGPICVSGCTTRERIYEDNSNRSFLIYLDNSEAQDDRIMEYQRAVSAGHINEKEKTEAASLLKNAQRLLDPIKVVNPYAELLKLPKSIFKPRRTNAHYLHFIEAVTFLHQAQREHQVDKETGEQYITTTLEDIENANHLLKDVLLKKSDRLSPACRDFFETLKTYLAKEEKTTFKNIDIRLALDLSMSQQKRYMSELVNHFYVQIKGGDQKKGYVYAISSFEQYAELKNQLDTVLDNTLAGLKASLKSTSKKASSSVLASSE